MILYVLYVGPRSLVNDYVAACYIIMDNTSWMYGRLVLFHLLIVNPVMIILLGFFSDQKCDPETMKVEEVTFCLFDFFSEAPPGPCWACNHSRVSPFFLILVQTQQYILFAQKIW